MDERALIDALRAGKIAGAGLDAFEETVLSPDHPICDTPNVFITPHIGGLRDRSVESLAAIKPNLSHYLAGKPSTTINITER